MLCYIIRAVELSVQFYSLTNKLIFKFARNALCFIHKKSSKYYVMKWKCTHYKNLTKCSMLYEIHRSRRVMNIVKDIATKI